MIAVQGRADRAADLAAGRVSPDPGRERSRRSRPTCPIPTARMIKSEKQTFKIEVVARELETPVGPRVPARRPPARHRARRHACASSRRTRQAAAGTVTGTPKVWERQDGGLLRRRGASAVRAQRLDLPRVRRAGPELHAAPPPAEGAAPAAPAPGRGGRGPQTPGIPSMTTIVRGKINKDNEWAEQQVIFRAPAELLHRRQLALRLALHLRPAGPPVLHDRRARRCPRTRRTCRSRLGKIHRVNDDGTVPKDNPFVNRAGALPTIWSYGHRNPQGLAWDPVTASCGSRSTGPHGGDEINIIEPGHNYGWGVITMGVQPGITKRSRAGDGAADRLLHADDRAERHDVLHRQPVSGLEEPPVRQRARRPAAPAARDQRTARSRTRKWCSTSSAACTTSSVGPDGYLYVTLQLPGQVLSALDARHGRAAGASR